MTGQPLDTARSRATGAFGGTEDFIIGAGSKAAGPLHTTNMPEGRRLGASYSVKKCKIGYGMTRIPVPPGLQPVKNRLGVERLRNGHRKSSSQRECELGRIGTAEEFADFFLTSTQGSYITGIAINADGARSPVSRLRSIDVGGEGCDKLVHLEESEAVLWRNGRAGRGFHLLSETPRKR